MPGFQPTDAEYLLGVLPLTPVLRDALQSFRNGKSGLSPADCILLRGLVGDRLVEVGFDLNYDLTPEGQRLEELIDLLFLGT